MKILNLEVKRCLGAFEQFMLYLLHDNIFTVEQLQSVAGTKVDGTCPSLLRYIERMAGRTSDLFTVNRYMNPFLGLVSEQLNNFFEREAKALIN